MSLVKYRVHRYGLKTLWHYEHHDKTTWKYLDYEVGYKDKKHKEPYIKKWILNPDFKYKHLVEG